ncbi:MAG: hypothetical protein A9183_00690 [Dehalococcoides mccartyi]|uniref:methyltransferase n=1 Tax=Dehalococcoides mccartyi TaxID=61435 RepID=UPI0008052A86|nr:class I SAM-dependent methyltransferase [Dehalococcoides mccartyi]OBW62926.1 MAG: hypothetical protein A9183_00690 [Dehalococcoides mccartyi]
MPHITPHQVWSVIAKNNRLFVPQSIEKAILDCIGDPIDAVKKAGEELITTFNIYDKAINLNYDQTSIVDAYSLYYLRRNSLIPRIAIRDMVLNHNLQAFPDQLHVLDLGSGTGAVTLGLLDMFLYYPFNQINITVDAVDISPLSLARLKQLQAAAGLSRFQVNTDAIDLNDVSFLDGVLYLNEPYDLIFVANVFNELEHQKSCEVLACLSKHLTDSSTIVIANAQRDFIKNLQPLLINEAHNDGLYVYYPCPPNLANNSIAHQCWFWREHDYDCNRLRTKGGQFISGNYRDELVATWLILSNKPYSIFDDFITQYPDLEWGTFRIWGKDSRVDNCQVCTNHGTKFLGKQENIYKRGSLVGCSGNPLQIQQYIEL